MKAAFKTAAGATLVWGVARLVYAGSALSAGWVGALGLVLLLHFGLFHLLALCWRAAGVDAQPLMNAPASATSLADFWSRRWNTGFNQLAREFAFRPLLRTAGPAGATMATFAVSGLIHDVVISLPAGAAFGLPTAYFLVQGAGVLFERSGAGHRARLGRGLRGWMFTLAVTAGPAFVLFHPWFILRVIVPFLDVIGAV